MPRVGYSVRTEGSALWESCALLMRKREERTRCHPTDRSGVCQPASCDTRAGAVRYNGFVEKISAFVRRTRPPKKRTRETERGELMEYFVKKLNRTRMTDGFTVITMSRMGKILEGIPTKDLYYLKRMCDDAYLRARAKDASGSKAFSKRFWWELDPHKHDER